MAKRILLIDDDDLVLRSLEKLLRNHDYAVSTAMDRMAPKCLEVFRLRKLEGLSHAEIGARLGISTKTVERHITRALQICHEQLSGAGGRTSKRGAGAGSDRVVHP